MGGFVVGIDGGRGPVATGALTRPWGGTVPSMTVMTYSLVGANPAAGQSPDENAT
jgi:hypothetical protein